MMDTVGVAPREREEGAALVQRTWRLVGALARELSPGDLPTGRWFTKLLSTYLHHYDAHALHTAAASKGTGAAATEAIIQRASVASLLSGAGSGSASTAITAAAADAGVGGLLLALPLSGLAVSAEMLVRAIIDLRMTCDLASAFGVRLEPEDLSSLYAIILGQGEEDGGGDALGRGRVERLVQAEARDVGEALGARLLGESMVRNFVPFLSVVTSPVVNWRHTRHVGESVLRYVRLRRALEDASAAVSRVSAESASLLLESAWFLFISDGRLRPEESAVLTHLLLRLPPARRQQAVGRFVEDTAEWLARLRAAPHRAREALRWSLKLFCAADLAAPPAERLLLRKASGALGVSLDDAHLESLMERYRVEGVAHAFAAPARGKKKAKGVRAVKEREAPAHVH